MGDQAALTVGQTVTGCFVHRWNILIHKARPCSESPQGVRDHCTEYIRLI